MGIEWLIDLTGACAAPTMYNGQSALQIERWPRVIDIPKQQYENAVEVVKETGPVSHLNTRNQTDQYSHASHHHKAMPSRPCKQWCPGKNIPGRPTFVYTYTR